MNTTTFIFAVLFAFSLIYIKYLIRICQNFSHLRLSHYINASGLLNKSKRIDKDYIAAIIHEVSKIHPDNFTSSYIEAKDIWYYVANINNLEIKVTFLPSFRNGLLFIDDLSIHDIRIMDIYKYIFEYKNAQALKITYDKLIKK
jgi:hypothetical protein